jgi:PhnB protein
MAKITPRLIVLQADRAIQFYVDVFSARVLERYASADGQVVHAALQIGSSVLALADEAPDWHNRSPASLGDSPVLLTLEVDDPDAVCARAVASGATVIFPIADQYYGHREGRIQDPFGHVWILSKVIEQLDPDEIARRARRGA